MKSFTEYLDEAAEPQYQVPGFGKATRKNLERYADQFAKQITKYAAKNDYRSMAYEVNSTHISEVLKVLRNLKNGEQT